MWPGDVPGAIPSRRREPRSAQVDVRNDVLQSRPCPSEPRSDVGDSQGADGDAVRSLPDLDGPCHLGIEDDAKRTEDALHVVVRRNDGCVHVGHTPEWLCAVQCRWCTDAPG